MTLNALPMVSGGNPAEYAPLRKPHFKSCAFVLLSSATTPLHPSRTHRYFVHVCASETAVERWSLSKEGQALVSELAAVEKRANGLSEIRVEGVAGALATPIEKRTFDQFLLLLGRQTTSLWRNGAVPRIGIYLGFAVLIGTTFLQVEKSLTGAIFRIASFFYAVFVAIIPTNSAIAALVQQRAPFYRETTSGTYSRWVYSLAQLFADVPLHLITATLFTLTFYWTVCTSSIAAPQFLVPMHTQLRRTYSRDPTASAGGLPEHCGPLLLLLADDTLHDVAHALARAVLRLCRTQPRGGDWFCWASDHLHGPADGIPHFAVSYARRLALGLLDRLAALRPAGDYLRPRPT